jgi:phosphoserine aminotransferase
MSHTNHLYSHQDTSKFTHHSCEDTKFLGSFSSGPTSKCPDWSLDSLGSALLGRSHRHPDAIERIQRMITLTRCILEIPENYMVCVLPGGATGAVETMMWNFLGCDDQPLHVFVTDVFSHRWLDIIQEQLKLKNIIIHEAALDSLPPLEINPDHHGLVCWNGSTSGMRIPSGDWICKNRRGLILCDGTSAVFSMDIPWEKLDVIAFSWQKGLGGEGSHGMLVLSPRAADYLSNPSHRPSWPIPWHMSLKDKGSIRHDLFQGMTLNTPSLLCLEDYLIGLNWAKKTGGMRGLKERVRINNEVIKKGLEICPLWCFVSPDESIRSPSTVCIHRKDRAYRDWPETQKWSYWKKVIKPLIQENQLSDILNHPQGTPGLRIWAGPTMDHQRLEKLWSYLQQSYHAMEHFS